MVLLQGHLEFKVKPQQAALPQSFCRTMQLHDRTLCICFQLHRLVLYTAPQFSRTLCGDSVNGVIKTEPSLAVSQHSSRLYCSLPPLWAQREGVTLGTKCGGKLDAGKELEKGNETAGWEQAKLSLQRGGECGELGTVL